jgi:hypothetical protein
MAARHQKNWLCLCARDSPPTPPRKKAPPRRRSLRLRLTTQAPKSVAALGILTRDASLSRYPPPQPRAPVRSRMTVAIPSRPGPPRLHSGVAPLGARRAYPTPSTLSRASVGRSLGSRFQIGAGAPSGALHVKENHIMKPITCQPQVDAIFERSARMPHLISRPIPFLYTAADSNSLARVQLWR